MVHKHTGILGRRKRKNGKRLLGPRKKNIKRKGVTLSTTHPHLRF